MIHPGMHRSSHLALRALSVRKLQASLSVLGIVFAVTAVVMMLAIAEGAKAQIIKQLALLGNDTLIVRSLPFATDASNRQHRQPYYGLTEADIRIIADNIEDVAHIAPLRTLSADVAPIPENRSPRVLATTAAYGAIRHLDTQSGRFLCELDVLYKNRVCVVGNEVAQWLIGHPQRGRTLLVNQKPFEIVGVLPKQEDFLKPHPLLGTINYNHTVLLPVNTVPAKAASSPMGKAFDEIHIQLSPASNVLQVGGMLKRLLTQARRGHKDFEIVIPKALLQQQQATQRTFNLVLGCIAFISLLVGGIGIMNIMLATVAERTKEIGIKRAVGATRRDIAREFLTESSLLTLAGGGIGLIGGVIGAFIVAGTTHWPVKITCWSVALALIMAATVGIFFGLFPACKAARMDPIEALRYE